MAQKRMVAVTLRLTLLQKDRDYPTGMQLGDSREAVLELGAPITIGRAPFVDIHVNAPSVGRQAVNMMRRAYGVWIYDQGSGGGSRIEAYGVITEGPQCPLPNGAILWIGLVVFRVEFRTRSGKSLIEVPPNSRMHPTSARARRRCPRRWFCLTSGSTDRGCRNCRP
jgi:hypothetical protein